MGDSFFIFTLTILLAITLGMAQTTTEAPIVPTDKICKLCRCGDTSVDCDDAQIDTFFTKEDWAGLQNMKPKRVVLSNNRFAKVTNIGKLPILSLDLSHGQIESVESASFMGLQYMRTLDLSYNKLSSESLKPDIFKGIFAPEEYLPLESLRVLNLSYNNLHSLDPDLFEHTTKIEELRLKGNPFKLLDHLTVIAISSLVDLKILDLSDCMLTKMEDNFLHTPRYLTWLDISGNNLDRVPAALEHAESVTFLNISYNPIARIDRNSSMYMPFYKMPSLVELHMCHMPLLTEIGPNAMSGLEKLEILYLNYNPRLTKIDPRAFETVDSNGEGKVWPLIKQLYINKNNLSNIDHELISRWDLLETVDVRHNPYMCDCTTQWMTVTLAPIIMEKSPDRTSDIICQEPIEMRGKSVIHLEEIHYKMRCVDKYGDRPEKDGMFLVGTLIGVLITVPILLGIMLLLKRGYCGLCGAQGPAAFSRQFYKRADTNDFL